MDYGLKTNERVMKKLILIMVAFAIIGSVSAQEKTKQKEMGVGLQNFDNFALIYKFGHQKSMWRLMGLYGNFSNYDYTNYEDDKNKQSSVTTGFSIGKQYHSYINEEFKILYGADIKFNYSYNKDIDDEVSTSKRVIYMPGLNAIFGFNYDMNNHFVVGLELLPGFNFTYSETKTDFDDETIVDHASKSHGFHFGVSSSSAYLTIAYRFGKKADN